MPIATKIIGQFVATIEQCDGGEAVQCWISQGRDAASLAEVADLGHIETTRETEIPVPLRVIQCARAFAESHGY